MKGMLCVFNIIGVIGAQLIFSVNGDRYKRQSTSCTGFDPCTFPPDVVRCYNGGTCHRNMTACSRVDCECLPGFSGIQCETKLETNVSDTTISNANVSDTSGQTATNNVTDTSVSLVNCNTLCLNTTCSNGGSCILNASACSAACSCANGYTGFNCEIPPLSCRWNLCNFGVTCVHGSCQFNSSTCRIKCVCLSGYYGDLCELETNSSKIIATTISPQNGDNGCPLGFPCVYGHCDTSNDSVSCICDENYVGHICSWTCLKKCGENGKCNKRFRTDVAVCYCVAPFEGEFCEDKYVPEGDQTWKYWLAGTLVSVILLLLVVILVGHHLVKKRNIFLLKVLYYFQPNEEDDGKLFDAFISYKSDTKDEEFVYNVLYPELEQKRGFHLCLHQRDFLVGETIVNNILRAVKTSRRTILVLSPEYMKSDFTRFEYQAAHREMIAQKHKVIPILLEDISSDMKDTDNTLVSIIQSITYLELPSTSQDQELAKFWKRLELSLPKKKVNAHSEHASRNPDDSLTLGQISIVDSKDIVCNEMTPNSTFSKPDSISLDGRKEMNHDNSSRDLKNFFNDPLNDEACIRIREQALKYEETLEV